MVLRRFKRKTESEVLVSSSSDRLGDLDRDGVQAKLQEIRNRIEELGQEGSRLFGEKMAGRLHDGQYNISTTVISMQVQHLEEQEQALLVRIEEIQRNIAQNALKAS